MSKTKDYGWTEVTVDSTGYIAPAILRVAQRHSPKQMLDAGCGNGSVTAFMHSHGFDITGVDGDERGIEIAKQRDPSMRFFTGDFAKPPQPSLAEDGLYDLVVSTEVIEHLYSPQDLVSYSYAALRPGGHFVITTPYHGYAKNLMLSLTDHWDVHHTPLWHGGHIKFWSKKTITALLNEGGLEVVDFFGVGRRIPFLWKSMVVTARKPG